MSTEEGSHTLADGQKLYTKTWKVRSYLELSGALLTPTQTSGPATARLVFIHGFSDVSPFDT
jgi:acylglycerol lipase